MRGLVLLFGWWAVVGSAVPAGLIDRVAVFAEARALAGAALPEVAAEELAGFRIGYELTLLETGAPDGRFEVDLLLRSSRVVLPAAEVVAAAADPAAAERLAALLAGTPSAYHYRTVRVRFSETGARPPAAEFSTLLLNRDPELPPVEPPAPP